MKRQNTSAGRGHAKATILHQEWLKGRIGALTLERMGYCPAEIEALERTLIRALINLHRLAPLHADYERLAA